MSILPPLTLAVLGLAACVTSAQTFPDSVPPRPTAEDPARPAAEAARRALEAGDFVEAARHFDNALWHRPTDAALLTERMAATQVEDLRLAWAHVLWASLADERGKVRVPRETKKLLPAEHPYLDRVATARAIAVAELADYVSKSARSREVGAPLLARFARTIAWDLARGAPGLWKKHGRTFELACQPRRDAYKPVIAALKRLAQDALGAGDTGTAIEAARCMRGLGAQSDFKDLKGPEPPELDLLEEQAIDTLRRARERLNQESGAPLTIEQLEEMDLEQRLAFTRDHVSFGNPGVALSETGKYRIETVCGWETLVGAATTIEMHHARLANWYGKDPFEGRPGLVRIVPEAEGLEAEGSPYWWAGGFQSGDLTVLRFNASAIPGLGRGLTHELTHRFDGGVFGGLPSWLMEGKAVWTGAAYGAMSETTFIPNHINFGTIENAMRKGYGGKDKLVELIEGTIDDYRDNYVAGYALFAYLNSWKENGRPLFADALVQYQEQVRAKGRDALGWFVSCFADGDAGRPKGIDKFAGKFATFLGGFYWLDRKPWTEQYTEKRSAEAWLRVHDFPTWQFSRNRAEPWFGQGQAARAGELLLGYGREKDAAAAFVWAFQIDEWSTARALRLADLVEKIGDKRTAWVLRNETWRRVRRDDVPNPGASPLLVAWPRVKAYLALLAEAAAHHANAGNSTTSARLAADAALYSRRLGLSAVMNVAPPAIDGRGAPFEPLARDAGWLGWEEDEFTGFEEHRVADLWYVDKDGGLHVGRHKPRDDTGQLDRRAGLRHAFTRSRDWIPPGRTRVTTRVHFTTTFVDGCIAVGWTRRDRNVRLQFSAGDYMYSIGQSESAAELDSVGASLHAVRDGESGWTGQTVNNRVEFDKPSTSFEVELLIDGALVMAFINGQLLGTYHSADGQPIEGYVGFGASFGAYRAERPTIETLDRQRVLGAADPRTIGLTLGRGGAVLRDLVLNRPVSGLPLTPRGTVVAWCPGPTEEDLDLIGDEETEVKFELRRRMFIAMRTAQSATELLWKGGYETEFVLCIPKFLADDAAERASLERELATNEISCRVVVHDKVRDLQEHGDKPTQSELPVLLFVDPVGVLRSIMSFMPGTSHLPSDLEYWLSIHRGR